MTSAWWTDWCSVTGDWLTSDWYLVIKCPVPGNHKMTGAWMTGEWLTDAWLTGEKLPGAWLIGAWLTGD